MDQPLLVDTMASTARIAQGLRDDETLEKMTLPEMLNAELHVLTFHSEAGVSMGAIFVSQDAQRCTVPQVPPNTDRFGEAAGQLPDLTENGHWYWRVCQKIHHIFFTSGLHGRISPIWAVSRDERTKLLKEKLAIIQEAQVATMTSGFAAASSLQLLRRDTLLQNFSFQPQVLSIVGTAPFEGSHVLGLEGTTATCTQYPTHRQDVRIIKSRSRKRPKRLLHPRALRRRVRSYVHNKPGCRCLIVWGLLVSPTTIQRTKNGWVSLSNSDLNSPIAASLSAPGTATRIYSRLWMPCSPKEP